jgi:transposase
MKTNINHSEYFTPIQMKFPVDLEKIIEISDPIYTFNEIMNEVDLRKYLVVKGNKVGRPRLDSIKLLKIILFAFMEFGYVSLRRIEALCKTDIRFIWLLDGMEAPSFMTIANFINEFLLDSIESIFNEINSYIFEKENVDLNHVYIDGTKLEANANKYSWVWKKSCITNRNKMFLRITRLIEDINNSDLTYLNVEIGTRQEYSVEYVEYILNEYEKLMKVDTATFVYGSGKRKTTVQKHYEKLSEYLERLKQYSHHIKTCGENRNSYSKTDIDATFMRNKRDYMGNDQLLPAYNVQVGICDEYIAVMDVQQFTSDMDCFIPLMEKFHRTYRFYPKYPVADAGYGSYNNYLFCHRNGMGKYMKFTMFNKETTDKKYHEDMFRAVNFKRDENGNLICPNNKKFNYLYSRPVKGNKFGRTEELYQCEDCNGCQYREKCHKSESNRIIRLNEELTSFHKEVINNLECVHGALLRMNRSIQAEGTYGTIKWNRAYTRVRRRGLKSVIFEFSAICLGFNLHKYHLKKQKALLVA